MARAAIDLGYEYLAITEHSKAVTVAKGLDEDALKKRTDEIRDLDDKLDHIRLFAGIEVDILKSGELDLDEKILSELDWVVASVHSYFKLEEEEMTRRVISALKSGVVHCFGHPTGRMIKSRDPIRLDLDRIFEVCLEHGVCLELNSQPDRLDLSDIHCRRAKNAGVPIVISTDAHQTSEYEFMDYGILTARRGWLEKGDVVNTRGLTQFTKFLKNRGAPGRSFKTS
jgi:DNA polymerase (family 10)